MKYVADKDGHWIPKQAPASEHHFVQGDIDFRSPDGVQIGSRSQWREHLKCTGSIEMGHSDMKRQHEKYMSKLSDVKETERQAKKLGVSTEYNDFNPEIRERQKTRVDVEVANRLHNRPVPEMKQLIKLTLETARELARRK